MAKNNFALNQPKKSNKKWLIAGLIIILLVAGGAAFAYFANRSGDNTSSAANEPPVNYDPPTEEEKKQVEENKDSVVDRQRIENTPPPDGRQAVKPVIVDASQYGDQVEVRAYVPGISENGGKCTMEAKKDTLVVRKETPGVQDASTTGCQSFIVPKSEFTSLGTWSVTVSYTSEKATGTSEASNLEVK